MLFKRTTLSLCFYDMFTFDRWYTFKKYSLFRMGIFGAAHGWRESKRPPPLPKSCHTYPTMMRLGSNTLPKENAAFLWEKLSQPQFYKDFTRKTAFFEGWSWFKFNNLGLALGTNLKFYTSVAKGLTLKLRKFLGLIPTFVRGKTGRGSFLPFPPHPELG